MTNRFRAGVLPVLPFAGGRVFSRRTLGAVIVLVCACSGGSAAAARDREDAVVDDAGRRVALAPTPRRIVSLLPSATELIVALGAGERLIARTGYDTQPALAHLPSFGRNITAGVEAIYALRPDLVITPPDYLTDGLGGRLAGAGLRVYEADAQRLDELLTTVHRLATLLDVRARGDSLLLAIRDGLDSLRAAHDHRAEPVDVVYVVWHAPASVAGGGTYVDDIIRAAGARNAFADVKGWPEVSAEALLARDPEMIIVPRGGGGSLTPERLRTAVGWELLPAVRAGRFIIVDADLFERPGPRVVEAARTLARGLHAEQSS